MAKLARERLLMDEQETIRKDPGGKVRMALVYPNSYAVGMSNLGFQTMYRLFNARPDVVCERAFLPEGGGPARTLESDSPLLEMDVVAFSLSFELDYPNIPRILRRSGIEPFAERRHRPFVLAGGPTMSYNPEPVAPFLDAAVVGEADFLVAPFVDALLSGDVDALALPGVYLPARGATPTARLMVGNLDAAPTYNQVFTPHTEFGEMALMEVSRGCPYGCRFCVASHVYKPARWRSLDALLPLIERGLRFRSRVGLIGASVTDHPQILELCEAILARGGEPSPASMRADALTDDLLRALARGNVRTITLAPEAGTEALRKKIGKGQLKDSALFTAAELAARAGIPNLKLYFIVGLPEETPEDVAAIPALVSRLAETGLRVSVGCSALVPKPGTPFARIPMAPEREVKAKLDLLRKALRGRADFTHESSRWSYWQAVLARGDRAQAAALARIAEGPDTPAAWEAAFRESGLDPDRYALDAIPPAAALPWGHIGGTRCEVE
jgi:radical SAM superfamily enzyme YgiQ (UPF0313 family)